MKCTLIWFATHGRLAESSSWKSVHAVSVWSYIFKFCIWYISMNDVLVAIGRVQMTFLAFRLGLERVSTTGQIYDPCWIRNNLQQLMANCGNIIDSLPNLSGPDSSNGWSIRHESEDWGLESLSSRGIFCLKHFDTFSSAPVRVSKMNAVARAQLTKIYLWCVRNKLQTICDKTKSILSHATNRQIPKQLDEVITSDTTIKRVISFQFLG